MHSTTQKLNPFTDLPAPPELFVGRTAELKVIKNSLQESLSGQPRHVLIIGERGMGKTSIAQYVEKIATEVQINEKRVFPVMVSLGDCRSIDDVCMSVIAKTHDRIKISTQEVIDRFAEFLKSLSSFGFQIGVDGIGFSVSRENKRKSEDFYLRFDEILTNMFSHLPKEYGTLLIILDELDYISSVDGFASFLKTLIEKLSRSNSKIISLLVAINPSQKQALEKDHETVIRGFTVLEIGAFSEQETESLIQKALGRGIPLKKAGRDFIKDAAHYCNGIPYFVHEVGKASFECDEDNLLDHQDFVHGVLGTSEVVGALKSLEIKHFRKRYEEDVLSNSYRRILQAIASFKEDIVSPKKIKEKLNPKDQKILNVYLSNMVERGVLKKMGGAMGQYSLPDRLFKIFLRMNAVKKQINNEGEKSG